MRLLFLKEQLQFLRIVAVLRLQITGKDQDHVNQCPNAQTAKGQQLNDANSGIPQVETVDAQNSNQERK